MPLPELRTLDISQPVDRYYAGQENQRKRGLADLQIKTAMQDRQFSQKTKATEAITSFSEKQLLSLDPNDPDFDQKKISIMEEIGNYAHGLGVPSAEIVSGAERFVNSFDRNAARVYREKMGLAEARPKPTIQDGQVIRQTPEGKYVAEGIEGFKSPPEKLIPKSVDMGNKIRLYYPDGRTEELPKGASPSTMVLADTRKPSDEMAMRKEFQSLPEVKEFPVIESQALRLDKAMEEAKKGGSLVAVDQALITVLNKMLDPSSVVRESEYARTPSDQAMLSRVKGKFEKLKSGGAGLTDVERKAIYDMTQRFKEVAQSQYGAQVDYYTDLSTRYGYRPENIVRLGGKKTSPPEEKTSPAPAGAIEMLKKNPALGPQFKAKYGYLPEGM